ncbi:hypothetical protein KFK09_003224 [Dendrobium nobile]|uniref:Uncharacterized protein n=1 Tax=Dendrobium nobile TaxID=94219 RepID=A0A8T3C638_DENNO|nr:hypothetical protein KFK09_003224 [Dendrobium nobile]
MQSCFSPNLGSMKPLGKHVSCSFCKRKTRLKCRDAARAICNRQVSPSKERERGRPFSLYRFDPDKEG